MGCQWDALYNPMLWSSLCSIIGILFLHITFRIITKKQVSCRSFITHEGIGRFITWILHELWTIHALWFGIKGWALEDFNLSENHVCIARPYIMVVVLPHLVLTVLPTILCIASLAVERGFYQEWTYTGFEKKEDDYPREKRSLTQNDPGSITSRARNSKRWLRKFLLLICFGIFWKHYKSCRALVKAYDMNPVVNFPCYSWGISYAVKGR